MYFYSWRLQRISIFPLGLLRTLITLKHGLLDTSYELKVSQLYYASYCEDFGFPCHYSPRFPKAKFPFRILLTINSCSSLLPALINSTISLSIVRMGRETRSHIRIPTIKTENVIVIVKTCFPTGGVIWGAATCRSME